MSRRHVETITDLLVVAITPALIIFLVGSLTLFLTHVFYSGEFPGRVRFACALFVMAAVLIGRISIEEGREYASLFAFPLVIVTVLSVLKYTDANLLFVPLIGFVWWSTDKLTWDCTVLEDRQDASGEGLLQTVGKHTDNDSDSQDAEVTTDTIATEKMTLWQRWLLRRRRHHAPGIWAIYFAAGGLLVFGLGQPFLPELDRPMGFLLLCVFVASTLLLLMATSFLQMRRYLWQRRLPFTDQIASVWLGTGGTIVVALMLIALLLPRPHTGYSLLESFDRVQNHGQRKASPVSLGDEGIRDERRPDVTDSSSDEDSPAQQPRDAANRENENASQETHNKFGDKTASAPDDRSDAAPPRSSEKAPSRGEGPRRPSATARKSAAPQRDESREPPPSRSAENQQAAHETSRQPAPHGPNSPLRNVSFGRIATWVYFLFLTVVTLAVLLRFGKDIASAVGAFLANLKTLFGRLLGGRKRDMATPEPAVAPTPKSKPFSSFADPFLMGTTQQFTPQQLVQYTFDALQAWAQERNCARRAEQTPLEFVASISRRDRQVGKLARILAVLYNHAAYAPSVLDGESTQQLKLLWMALRRSAA